MAVRRESVRLSLEDAGYSTGMARAAASTMLLDRALDALDGSHGRVQRSTDKTGKDVDRLSDAAVRGSSSIDQYSGRLRILAEAIAVLGPAIVPLGGLAAAAVGGLASQVGFAAIGMGSLLAASQGVGDALKAVEKARLEPTAENINAARDAMSQLAPETQAFVTRLQQVLPVLRELRDASAAGWFSGLTVAVDELETAAPRFEYLLRVLGQAGGSLAAEGANWFNTESGQEFLTFLEDNAPSALEDLGHSIGNVTSGLASLWMAFDPVNDDFSSWILEQTRAFAEWADGLSATEGYKEFVEYLRTNGPKVADTAGAIAGAMIEVVEAIAPLGGPSLEIIEQFAKAVGAIADSDLGTPIFTAVAAYAALNRVLQVTAALQRQIGKSTAIGDGMAAGGVLGGLKGARTSLLGLNRDMRSTMALAGRATATLGGITLATSGVADGFGLANTAALGLTGWGVGGPVGGAIGSAVGLLMDAKAASEDWGDALQRAQEALDSRDVDQMNKSLAEYESRLARLNDLNDVTGVGDFFSDIWGLQVWNDGSWTESLDARIATAKDKVDTLRSAINEGPDANPWTDLLVETADHFSGAGDKAKIAAEHVSEFRTEYASLNALLSQQGAWSAYQEAIDNVTESVKQNGRTLNEDTAAGRANAEAVRNVAERILGYAETLSGTDRETFLRNHRKALVDAMHKAGGTTKAMRELLTEFDQLDGVIVTPQVNAKAALDAFDSLPKEVQTDIQVNGIPQTVAQVDRLVEKYKLTEEQRKALITASAGGAFATIDQVVARLGGIRDKNITITTQWRNIYAPPRNAPGRSNPGLGLLAPGASADGSTVPKDGGPYGDRYHYLLAPGEEVISNRHGQADRHRPLLKAINAGMLADGGTAMGVSRRALPALPFADLPGLRLATMSLKELNEALKDSERALERETAQRDSVVSMMTETRSALTGRVTTDLFGETGDWTSGGTVDAAIATNLGDIRKANVLAQQIAILKAKGLDGPALDELLSKSDDATLSNFVGASKTKLAQYESSFEIRAGKAAATASFGANAAWGPELRLQTKQMELVADRVALMSKRVERVEKAIDRNTRARKAEQDKARRQQRGASGRVARSGDRGTVKR